jgi:hypothetical protein
MNKAQIVKATRVFNLMTSVVKFGLAIIALVKFLPFF